MRWSALLWATGLIASVAAQQDTSCSALKPCLQGCCSKYGQCGFGDEFCGDGCQGTCDAKPECGDGADEEKCPLGVCCSKYGFCGTTHDFCTDGCQNGCEPVSHKTCDANTDALALKRRIAYYEIFNLDRECNRFLPEHIPAGALTHINIAFGAIGTDFKVVDDPGTGDAVARVAHLKDQYPGLRVNIALGGWVFNDAPTQHVFSDMVGSYENQQTFINSLSSYITKYSLDGVDIDWEYPVAADRGGIPEDYDNFVTMLASLREAFDRQNPGYEISITLPSSYWYLRGFNLKSLEKAVDYFNVMTYDLHGMWDQHNRFTGPYLKGHTNLTEIEDGLDLLWRNGVDPANVVMGFGFYGRSFTMSDPTCHDPAKGCTFSAAGLPGDCSDTAGILTYQEVKSRNESFNAETYYDPKSSVKYTTYQYDQWVSYDDAESFADKKRFLTSHCLSGLMIWAVDQDTQNYEALSGLLGQEAIQASLFQGSQLSDAQNEQRSQQFAAFTGQNCFVTELCTDGSDKESGPKQKCPAGTTSMETAHAPLQINPLDHGIVGQCSEGWYRHICCPTNEAPKNCKWNGAPVRSEIGCSGKCSKDQFELASDTFTSADGHGQCYQGERSLCCDSTELLNDCFWTDCQGPLLESQMPGELGTPGCPADTEVTAMRYDTDDGGWCSRTIAKSDLHSRFKRALCCPKKESFKECAWSNNNVYNPPKGEIVHPGCQPQACYKTQTKIAEARQPAPIPISLQSHAEAGFVTIADICPPLPAEYSDEFALCCNPPSEYNERWPVPPHYLWENAFEGDDDDVAWTFADNTGNNNKDTTPNDLYEDPGEDPYGFIMLDGGPESLDSNFGNDFTVARRSADPPITKRSWLTSNQTIHDATFDHSEETVYVYCNHPEGSEQCEKPFVGGAPDTIIGLPAHVGEGPYARIVSMEVAPKDYSLPSHHIRARSAESNKNTVYKLKFDYKFHAIRDDKGPVNMRIDYTNLQDYWDEVTGAKPNKRSTADDEPMSKPDWQDRIKRASKKRTTNKRDLAFATGTTDLSTYAEDSGLHKRWFGKFGEWLSRLNKAESHETGFLTMALQKSFLLYEASKGCVSRAYFAKIQMFLDTNVQMDATYAYYFSGTIVPPHIDKTYAYLGVEPSAYLGLRIEGQAQLVYESERKKLIDTLAYPGLSIKGIATIGPSLDVFGQIRGKITLNGQIKAGATAKFGKAELFFPQDSDGESMDELEGIKADNSKPQKFELEPQFYATAKAEAALQIIVSPEAKLGLVVAPKILGKDLFNLVDAQLIAFVNGTLQFNATAIAEGGTDIDPSFTYRYGAYLIFNLGYGGYAHLASGTWNWDYASVYAYPYPGKQYTIYENGNEKSDNTPNSKRSIDMPEGYPHAPSRIWSRAILDDESKALLQAAAKPEKLVEVMGQHESLDGEFTNNSMSTGVLFGKRDDGDASDSAVNVQDPAVNTDAQSFTCPPRGTEDVTLPDFRYNCLIFASTQLQGNGGSVDVPGICDGITQFFGRRALSSNGLELTYEPTLRDDRDKLVCGTSFCMQTNKDLRSTVGLPAKKKGGQDLTSCDEFPFGSTEEGGDFFSKFAQRKSKATATCVPVWQQSLQGNCNKLLGLLNTNIAHFDREQGSDETDPEWKAWSLKSWITSHREGDENVTPFERLTHYPNAIPKAPGINLDDWNDSDMTLGKNFKRNYTFGLAYTQNVADTEWGSQAFSGATFVDTNIPGGRITDATAVGCAVNTHGQPDIFRWSSSGWNGFCYRGPGKDVQGWGTPPSFARCRIDFVGSTFQNNVLGGGSISSKRDEDGNEIIGTFGGEGVTRIYLDPDTEYDIDIDDGWVPDADQMMPVFST